MINKTLLFIAHILFISFSISAQTFNYEVERIGSEAPVNGTETYRLNLIASESVENINVVNFTYVFEWPAGAFENFALLNNASLLGPFANYAAFETPKADSENFYAPSTFTVDFVDVTYSDLSIPQNFVDLDITDSSLKRTIAEFTVTRLVASEVLTISRNTETLLTTNPGPRSVDNVFNTFITDPDGSGNDRVVESYDEDLNEPVLSLEDIAFLDTPFNIYPIPSSGTIYIDNPIDNSINCTVYSLDGTAVFQKMLSADSTSSLELGNLPKGVYLATLSANGNNKTTKLIIN